jgi:dienelactone hydrolase
MRNRPGIFVLMLLSCVATTRAEAASAVRYHANDVPLRLEAVDDAMCEQLQQYWHEPDEFEYSINLMSEQPKHRVYELRFPSPHTSPWPINDVVPCELYVPRELSEGTAAVIVLDILNGAEVLPRMMARRFADAGIVAMYVPLACYGKRQPPNREHLRLMEHDPTLLVEGIRQSVMDIRRAKAILASRDEVDPQRICISGISLGGIITTLAAGVDGDFYRVIPILAGGDLAEILFHARETRRIRALLQAHGLSVQATRAMIEVIEPLTFASRIDPARCLMINAAADEVIPRHTTDALHRAIGRPTILWTPLGHYTSAWYLPNVMQRSIDFVLGKEVTKLN